MASSVGAQVATGTVEGTGAEIEISLPFKPKYVHVVNVDGNAEGEWFYPMAQGAMHKRTATTYSLETADGISVSELYELEDTGLRGFTIGADTDLNVANESLWYVAWG